MVKICITHRHTHNIYIIIYIYNYTYYTVLYYIILSLYYIIYLYHILYIILYYIICIYGMVISHELLLFPLWDDLILWLGGRGVLCSRDGTWEGATAWRATWEQWLVQEQWVCHMLPILNPKKTFVGLFENFTKPQFHPLVNHHFVFFFMLFIGSNTTFFRHPVWKNWLTGIPKHHAEPGTGRG